MVQARAVNIRSGWKSLFTVFTIAASDTDGTAPFLRSASPQAAPDRRPAAEAIVRLAFEIVAMIMKDYFHLICDGFFVECVNCLIAYGNNRHFRDFSFKAIESLGFCAEQLAGGHIPASGYSSPAGSAASPAAVFTDSEAHLRFWFPILTGLSCIISHPHIDVRTKCVLSYAALPVS